MAHALRPAVLLDLGGVGVVVRHEEVVPDRLDAGRAQHAERRRRVDHAVQPSAHALAVRVAQHDLAALDEVPVLRMSQAAGQDPRLFGAQRAQDRRQQHGASERVGIPHPLREDVRTAAADRLGAALEAHVRGVGLRQDRQVLERTPLAHDRLEAPADDVRAGVPRRCEDAAVRAHEHALSGRWTDSWRRALPRPSAAPLLPVTTGSAPCGMKRSALPGHLGERGRRFEALAVRPAQPLETLERERRTEVVQVPEWPAEERREAEPEDRPHVAVAWRAKDTVLQAGDRFVEEREDQPVLDLPRLEAPAAASRRAAERRRSRPRASCHSRRCRSPSRSCGPGARRRAPAPSRAAAPSARRSGGASPCPLSRPRRSRPRPAA